MGAPGRRNSTELFAADNQAAPNLKMTPRLEGEEPPGRQGARPWEEARRSCGRIPVMSGGQRLFGHVQAALLRGGSDNRPVALRDRIADFHYPRVRAILEADIRRELLRARP